MKKKMLICGATGLVGTNALIRLKAMPEFSVRAVYHTQKPQIFSDNISYVEADLADCKRAAEGIDYVMMFAAKIARRSSDLEYLAPNLAMSLGMLEAAYQAGVKKYLWLSTATAYPPGDTPARENEMFCKDPDDTNFAVGWMSRYIEILCRMYATKLKRQMTTIVLRATAIYGEYCDFDLATRHVLPALIRRVAERQEPLEIWGTGEVKRDFIYVGDVLDASFLALDKVEGFAELNIGSGRSYSVKELLSLILDIDSYANARTIFVPSKGGKAPSISVDCRKAKELIGFEAKTPVREGIVKTMEWFKKSGGVIKCSR